MMGALGQQIFLTYQSISKMIPYLVAQID